MRQYEAMGCVVFDGDLFCGAFCVSVAFVVCNALPAPQKSALLLPMHWADYLKGTHRIFKFLDYVLHTSFCCPLPARPAAVILSLVSFSFLYFHSM